MSEEKKETPLNKDDSTLQPEKKRVKRTRDFDYMTRIYYHPIRRVIKLFMTQKPTLDYLKHVFQDDKIIGSHDILETFKQRKLLDAKNEIFEHLIHVIDLKDYEPKISVNVFGEIFNCFIQYHERQITKKQTSFNPRNNFMRYNNRDLYQPEFNEFRDQRNINFRRGGGNQKNFDGRGYDPYPLKKYDNRNDPQDNYRDQRQSYDGGQNYPQREQNYRQDGGNQLKM